MLQNCYRICTDLLLNCYLIATELLLNCNWIATELLLLLLLLYCTVNRAGLEVVWAELKKVFKRPTEWPTNRTTPEVRAKSAPSWDWTGTGLGLGWDWAGTGLGLDWDWAGTGPGLDWDWAGTGPGLDWDWTGTGLGLGLSWAIPLLVVVEHPSVHVRDLGLRVSGT